MNRSLASIAFAFVLIAMSHPAFAQGDRGFLDPDAYAEPTQVLSANPIGFAVRYYNLEYEARVHDAFTAGIGGATLDSSIGLGEYANSDVFVRYYPGGRAFRGLSVGLKAGLTTVGSGGQLAGGVGFDVNANHWINERVVVSAGVGMKRVFAGSDAFNLPTIRIINIGIAF